MKLKLRAIGTSTGVVLPKEILTRLKVKKDDSRFAVETPAGYLLIPYDREIEKRFGLGRVRERFPRISEMRNRRWLDFIKMTNVRPGTSLQDGNGQRSPIALP